MTNSPTIYSFAPLVGDQPRVMVLGSMPGADSLKAQQYYAHPRNAFWPIMANHFDFALDTDYAQRCKALTACGVLVWDVLQACVRRGSLDSAIRTETEVPNDFATLLQNHPIGSILFNGAKAEASFLRHVLPALMLDSVKLKRLPSTSPAYAAMSRSAKQSAWSDALDHAGLPRHLN